MGCGRFIVDWGRVGEQWAWEDGKDRMGKPENWVDVMKLVKERQGIERMGK